MSITKRVYIWKVVDPAMQETFETFLREFVKEYQDADDTELLVRELANSLAFEVEKGIREGIREGIRKRNELLMKGDQTCQ